MHVLFYLRFLKLFPLSFVYLSWQVGFEIWFAKRMWFHWVQLSPLKHGMQREMIKWFQKIDAMISIEDLRMRRCNLCGFFFLSGHLWRRSTVVRRYIFKAWMKRSPKSFSLAKPWMWSRRSLRRCLNMSTGKNGCLSDVKASIWYRFFPQQPGGIQHFLKTNWTRSPGNHGYHFGQTSIATSSRRFYSFQPKFPKESGLGIVHPRSLT